MSDQTPPPAPAYVVAPVHPQSTLVLVFGILSLVCCGFLTGVPGIIIGRKALKEVDASGGQIAPGSLKAGYICSIIGTAYTVAITLFYVVFLIIALVVGSNSGSTY